MKLLVILDRLTLHNFFCFRLVTRKVSGLLGLPFSGAITLDLYVAVGETILGFLGSISFWADLDFQLDCTTMTSG